MDKEEALKAYQRVVAFTSEFCPNWTSSECVADADRLFRYLDGEELDPADVKNIERRFKINRKIQKSRIIEDIAESESILIRDALEAFYSELFDIEEKESEDCEKESQYDGTTFTKIERVTKEAFNRYARERNIQEQIIDIDVYVYEDMQGGIRAELTAEYDDSLCNQIEIDFTDVEHLEDEHLIQYAYSQILQKY